MKRIAFAISIVFLSVLVLFGIYNYCGSKSPRQLTSRVIVFEDFEQFSVGKLRFTTLASSLGNTSLGCGKLDFVKFELGITPHPIFIKEERGNKYLKVLLQKGRTMPVTGSQWDTQLDSSYSELTLSYRVKFDSAFAFKPGKLLGLRAGNQVSGIKPNGKDGFAARLMYWKEGRLSLYIYHPDQKIRFGDIVFDSPDSSSFCFAVNRWYAIAMHVKVNDVGKANGLVYAMVDGKEVLRKENIRFRDVATLGFDNLSFSAFANEIAPAKDEYMYFDDIKLTTN